MKTTVITGAASGIGYALAELLLERRPDIRLALLDLNTDAMEPLHELGGDRVSSAKCNVADMDSVERAIAETCGTRPTTGLVTCAGILRNEASIDLTVEQWREMIGVQLDGSFFVAQTVAKRMIETGGSIVFIASVAMDFGWPRRLPYAVAKAGTGALTRTLAVEWAAHGIRVNAVSPGYVDSQFVRDGIAAGLIDGPLRIGQHALGRFAESREIAEAIEFLLSDRASFITGEVLRVDGGFAVQK